MIERRKFEDLGHADHGWLRARHHFSCADYHDPARMGWGRLRVWNDDEIAPGTGFPPHPHADMEIVTWVLRGELEHRDSEGNHGIIYPGLAQRMSAGTGIRHSEVNHSATADVHLVQMWVLPDTRGITPGYEQQDLTKAIEAGGLVTVASGRGHDGAVTIHQRDAALLVGRLREDERVEVPTAPHVHVFVPVGTATLGGHALATGDAARVTDAGALEVVAGPEGAEVLVWLTA